MTSETYHRADLVFGKCSTTPAFVEAVQFHGIQRTQNDALGKEVSGIYKSASVSDLIQNCSLAAKHMKEVGLLSEVTALVDTSSNNPNGYIVNFIVKEPKSVSLGMKVGVTTRGNGDLSFNCGSGSVFGRGESMNSSYCQSVQGEKGFSFSILKPFLGWQKYSNLSMGAYRDCAKLDWNLSNAEENGLVLQCDGQLWKRKLLSNFKLNMAWRKFCPLANAVFSIREYAGHTMKCSLQNSVALDTRNNSLIPSKGILIRVLQEFAGFLGDAAFIRHQFDFQAAAPFMFGTFLGASIQASVASSLSNRCLHLLDRVYVGGPYGIRGFELNSIGAQSSMYGVGGRASVTGVLHIYRPLIPAEMVFAHAFVASGSIASVLSEYPLSDMLDAQRMTAGLGIALKLSKMIRIEVNYVWPLRYMIGDKCKEGFHFGAGINFL